MSIHAWQKATLSVMAGGVMYSGFLYALAESTAQTNRAAAQKAQAITAHDQKLLNTLKIQQAQTISLFKKLQAERQTTAKLGAQIAAVNKEIAQITTGHTSTAGTASAIQATPTVTAPGLSAPVQMQPPPVQSVTKAS